MEEKRHSGKSDTITMEKATLWKIATGIFALLFIIMLINNNSGTTAQPQQAAGSEFQTINADLSKLIGADSAVIGSADAPVTIVEFSDFSCPYCAMASGDNAQISNGDPIVTTLMKDYIQTGKVRFAVKYMMGHSGGHPAQLVAWCLNDQSSDLYWKFYPQAFAHQEDVEDAAKMSDLAKSVGADMTKLQSCLDSNKFSARFDTEQNEGRQLGISGTPGFLLEKTGGKTATIISGAYPFAQVRPLIEAALK